MAGKYRYYLYNNNCVTVSKKSDQLIYQGQRRKSWTQQIFVLLFGCQHVSMQAIQYSPCKHKIHNAYWQNTRFWKKKYQGLTIQVSQIYLHWNRCPVGCPKKWIKQDANALTVLFHIDHCEQPRWYKLTLLSPRYNIWILTCHPMPRLIIDGGIIVALAYLEAPMKAPVDYKRKKII